MTTAAVAGLDFRNAMARLPAAVSIVTTDGPGGRAGFTATAVCSVSDDPPTLLVCLNRSASVHPVFAANEALCVNVLGAQHRALSDLFGGKTPMDGRFAAAQWRIGATGAPQLLEAAAMLDCRVVERTRMGTHDVLFCAVQEIRLGEPEAGLAYFGRRYHDLAPAQG